jgi:ubiquinone/menaquinone biosynthesis C-methylase UbiE
MAVRVEYDRVAPDYDRRFREGGLPGVADALRRATEATRGERALEVGCGTGHWLSAFGAPRVLGADRSLGMLARAAAKSHSSDSTPAHLPAAAPFTRPRADASSAPALVAADAHALPFDDATFDVVACVNALHHFGDPARFIERASKLLRDAGALVIVGMDPSAGRDRWYLYDYFPESLPADLERYPPPAAIRRWMHGAGLERVTTHTAQRIQGIFHGEEVFQDPILHRHGTSQLTMLDDAAFARGMQRIREAVRSGATGTAFVTDIVLPVTRGFVAA